jgi:aminocarboxymuconate-semialdehyde decarboxylase
VRLSNDVIADRVASHPDRFGGTIAVTFQDVAGSVAEIDRMAERGFRAVFMYAKPEIVGSPEVEPLFAKIAERGLPVFLHGGGVGGGPQTGLDLLEDDGQGVTVSAHADGAVADFVVRTIAAGLFDRYPGLQFVIRSSGGSVPLLLGKLYWKHKGPDGERTYRDILLDHFLVDCASASPRTLRFLLDTMGEERVVFGSDYCGGLGPITKALPVLEGQADPGATGAMLERNSLRLLGI